MRDAAAQLLVWSQEAIAAREVFHLALSGGSTPNALFRVMSGDDFRARFDWSRIHLWWSDERYLPLDHPELNYSMADAALIQHITIPESNVHRVRVELPALQAADAYESHICQIIGSCAVPVFDVILLGLGDDGHTASLFPGTVNLLPAERLVVAHDVPKVQMWRITFTPRLINAAHHVVFLVSGAGKADVVWRVLHSAYQPDALPAQLVSTRTGDLTWMLDESAANP